ncbi:MAG: hypothetical protein L0241_08530, partial [Planctomycetia bacterium]|nr:hypothetical protein [Planctomycetia bacterium]
LSWQAEAKGGERTKRNSTFVGREVQPRSRIWQSARRTFALEVRIEYDFPIGPWRGDRLL